jgi:hypothetical protein
VSSDTDALKPAPRPSPARDAAAAIDAAAALVTGSLRGARLDWTLLEGVDGRAVVACLVRVMALMLRGAKPAVREQAMSEFGSMAAQLRSGR